MILAGCWSGGLGEGDGEAEFLEVADVSAYFPAGAGTAGVVAGAEVAVAGGGTGEEVPDDDEDGTGDRDEGLELAAAPDEAPVAPARNVPVLAAAVAASPTAPLR